MKMSLKLSDLKSMIRDHAKAIPKMSAGKLALHSYASAHGLIDKHPSQAQTVQVEAATARQRAGVVEKEPEIVVKKSKGKEVPMKDPVVKSVPVLKAETKKPAKKAEEKEKPEEKKPAKKPAKKAEEEKPKGGFAGFMSAHKGMGHSMKDLAAMYKAQKKS
jgi:hypothetical protein